MSAPLCGTVSGEVTHRRKGEEVCRDCRAARNAYSKKRRDERRAERAEQDRIWGDVA